MVDSSWDNSGQGAPAKTGLPLWGKLGLGCGVALLILMGTCVGGAAFVRHKLKQDPEGFKNKVMGFALDKMKPDWDDFRAVVAQRRTPDGPGRRRSDRRWPAIGPPIAPAGSLRLSPIAN